MLYIIYEYLHMSYGVKNMREKEKHKFWPGIISGDTGWVVGGKDAKVK